MCSHNPSSEEVDSRVSGVCWLVSIATLVSSGFCERACFLRDLHDFSLDRKMGNKGLSVKCFSSLGVEIELQRAL